MKKIILVLMVISLILNADYYDHDGNRIPSAKEQYEDGCKKRSSGSCFNLGEMYREGFSVRQDKSTAKELFGQACDLGLERGCRQYRILNEEGIK